MSSIQEKLSDLQEQAKENSSFANNICNILQKHIDSGKITLEEIKQGKDFFTAIAFLNAQRKAPKIEQFILKKLDHQPVPAEEGRGDGKDKNGKYYEYKISTTNEDKQINALQIRLGQFIDYYLLGYIDERQFENSRLYLLPHDDMKTLCEEYREQTHGTQDEIKGKKIEEIEMTLRIKMDVRRKSKSKELKNKVEENFRANDLEEIIFN